MKLKITHIFMLITVLVSSEESSFCSHRGVLSLAKDIIPHTIQNILKYGIYAILIHVIEYNHWTVGVDGWHKHNENV
jgi:hypothetical protein